MNSDNPTRIGIIIPAFNVEKYILRAIEACKKQTYTNIEIIIVDDGSTDKTFSIAKKASELDNRIYIHHQKNSGVSVARNYALDLCTSDYIIFLDSDDWIEPDTVEKMIEHLPKNKESCLVCADAYYAYFGERGIWKEKAPYIADAIEMDSKDALLYISQQQYKLRSACYKLFSMKIIKENNLRFDENIKHGEDGLFVFEYLKCVSSFVYFPEPLWNILERPNSATQLPYSKSWLTAIDAVEKMLAYKNSQELDKELRNYKVRRMVSVLCHAIGNISLAEEDVKFLKKELRKECVGYLLKEDNLKNKLFYLFAVFSPVKIVSLYCRRRV